MRRENTCLDFFFLNFFGSTKVLVMHNLQEDKMKLFTNPREVHVRPAAKRTEIFVSAAHGSVHTPKTKQVPTCVHYRLVNKL